MFSIKDHLATLIDDRTKGPAHPDEWLRASGFAYDCMRHEALSNRHEVERRKIWDADATVNINEELFFVLEGKGSIRIGEATYEIRAGDLIDLPPGPDSAHQIRNDSDAPLRYLAVSTMESPEVVEYPDSRKLGVLAGAPPGRATTKGSIRHFTKIDDAVEYWEGEE